MESALNLISAEVASDELDFRALSLAIFLCIFYVCNVDNHIQLYV